MSMRALTHFTMFRQLAEVTYERWRDKEFFLFIFFRMKGHFFLLEKMMPHIYSESIEIQAGGDWGLIYGWIFTSS